MAFNVPSAVMALNPEVKFTFDPCRFTAPQLSKFKKAATSGVARKGGVGGALGLMLRSAKGLQCMAVRTDSVHIFNMKDKSILESVEASIVLAKIEGMSVGTIGIYGYESIEKYGYTFDTIEDAKRSSYKIFRIYMFGISGLIKSPKLEPMEVDTKEPIVLYPESMSILSRFH